MVNMIYKTGFLWTNGAAPTGTLYFNLTNLALPDDGYVLKKIHSRLVELNNANALPTLYVPHSILIIPSSSGAFTGGSPFGMDIQGQPTLAMSAGASIVQPIAAAFTGQGAVIFFDRLGSESLDRDIVVAETLPYRFPRGFQIEVDCLSTYTAPANFNIKFEIELYLEKE